MIFTIILIVICALILITSVYFIAQNKAISRSSADPNPPRWRHNDGNKNKVASQYGKKVV